MQLGTLPKAGESSWRPVRFCGWHSCVKGWHSRTRRAQTVYCCVLRSDLALVNRLATSERPSRTERECAVDRCGNISRKKSEPRGDEGAEWDGSSFEESERSMGDRKKEKIGGVSS